MPPRSLASYRALFSTLVAPSIDSVRGLYAGELVGPGWLRRVAPTGLALGGLRGWWGKEFDGAGGAVNLVLRDGRRVSTLPMAFDARPSLIDGEPAAVLTYPPTAPFPWRRVADELRRQDDGSLLGLSVLVTPRWARKLALPFVLRPHPEQP